MKMISVLQFEVTETVALNEPGCGKDGLAWMRLGHLG